MEGKLLPTPTKVNEPSSCSAITLSLKRTLQSHIKGLVKSLPSLQSAEKDGEKHILALANLLEQRECINRADGTNVEIVSAFPDLKSRLMLKISAEVEKEIEFLLSSIIPLRGVKQASNQARADILSFASSSNAKDIDQVTMHEGSPTVPPLTTMMDSIQTVEKEARDLYCARTHYLENILESSSLITPEKLHDLWMEDSTKVINAIKDCREIVKFFLDEKL